MGSWPWLCHEQRGAGGPGVGTAAVHHGAHVPSATLSRQMAAGTRHSPAARGDLPRTPTLE